MASVLPDYKQEQRIGQTTGVTAVSPSEAGAAGENIAQTGKELGKFGVALAEYQDAKKRVDYSLLKGAADTEATLHEQDSVAAIRTNRDNNVAPDGSNMMQLLDEKFQPLYDKASAIEDGTQRQVVMNAYQTAHAQAREKIMTAQIAQHASYSMFALGDQQNQRSNIIFSDPSRLQEQLSKARQDISNSSLDVPSQIALGKQVNKDFALAAVNGATAAEDYAGARKLLASQDTNTLSEKERADTLKHINDTEMQQTNQKFKVEQQQRTEMKQKQKDQKDATAQAISSEMLQAPTIAARQSVLDKYKGQMTAQDYSLFSNLNNNLSDAQGHEAYAKFEERIANRQKVSNSEVTQAAYGDNPTITMKQADALYTKIGTANKPKAHNFYAEQDRQAIKDIAAVYQPSKMQQMYGMGGNDQLKGQMMDRYTQLKSSGMSPMAAKDRAFREIDPTNPKLVPVVPGVTSSNQRGGEALDATIKKVVAERQRAKAAGTLTPDQNSYAIKVLKGLLDRQKNMKKQDQQSQVIKDAQTEKVIKSLGK